MREHRAPRLLGTATAALGLVVLLALVAFSGGAAALPGPTDLGISKTDSPDPVTAGNNLTYTITVTNPNATGENDASNVVVTDTLPSGVDFVSATGGICSRAGTTVTCNLGQVNAATTATVTIVVKTKKDGMLSNTANVTSPDDGVTGNNSATATTTVNKAPTKAKGKGKKKGQRATCARPTIAGTNGDDVLVGTPGPDVIASYLGRDQVYGGGGADLICTGGGADLVLAGAGRDTAKGGRGPDKLFGGSGRDLLKGKSGRDKLRGQGGGDVLIGGKKRDNCKGGAGRDLLLSCP